MPIARLRALWRDIYESLWFVPAVCTLVALILSWLLIPADSLLPEGLDRRNRLWLFGGGADSARAVLGAIGGSIITVTGVVFSVTIVALQLASSQYTPRVLRTFMGDRASQLVLGVFIGTFVYSLSVMRSIYGAGESYEAFVPAIAVTVAVASAIVSIGFLIFYIHHVAASIRVEHILATVTEETLDTIRRQYPQRGEDDADLPAPAGEPRLLRARRSGYLTAIDEDRLLRFAREHSCLVQVAAPVGAFVHPGSPLVRYWGEPIDDDIRDELQSAFALNAARTQYQDFTLGVVELLDIAVKALSPGINDPTTAMNAVDRLGEVLLELGGRSRRAVRRGGDGETVLLQLPSFDETVDLAFQQISHYGADNPAVVERIAGTIGDIGALLPPTRRPRLLEELERLRTIALEELTLPFDRERVTSAVDEATQRIHEERPPAGRPAD